MPVWLIELFAHAQLTKAFWFLNVMTVPVWLLMLLFPKKAWMRKLASPFFLPVIYAGIMLYFFYLAAVVSPPELPADFDFSQSKAFIAHPLVLLAIWCQIHVSHLLLGTLLFREGSVRKMSVRVELILTWALGPMGWGAFALRLLFSKKGGIRTVQRR